MPIFTQEKAYDLPADFAQTVALELLPLLGQHAFVYEMATKRLLYPHGSAALGFGDIVENVPESFIAKGYYHADSIFDARQMYAELDAGLPRVTKELCVRDRDAMITGDEIYYWEKLSFVTRYDAGGKPLYAVGMFVDTTKEHNLRNELEQERLYRAAVASDAWMHLQADITADTIQSFSSSDHAGFILEGYTSYRSFVQHVCEKYVDVNSREVFAGELLPEALTDALLLGHMHRRFQYLTWQPKRGRYAWVSASVGLMQDPATGHVVMDWKLRDADAEKSRELGLRERVDRDGHTKLLNRAAYEVAVDMQLSANRPKENHCALFMLDVDNFKTINDKMGHLVGDEVLLRVAKISQSIFRAHDYIARLGGDEFSIFMFDVREKASIAERAQQLSDALQFTVRENEKEHAVTCSIGVAVSPEDGADFASLYRRADAALYHVKRAAKNGFAFYVPEMQDHA